MNHCYKGIQIFHITVKALKLNQIIQIYPL